MDFHPRDGLARAPLRYIVTITLTYSFLHSIFLSTINITTTWERKKLGSTIALSTSEIRVRIALALLLPAYIRIMSCFSWGFVILVNTILTLATALITTCSLWYTRRGLNIETDRTLDIELAVRVIFYMV